MALVSFGYRVDMYTIAPPTDPAGYIVAYDLDGVLKQKNHLGVVSLVGSGAGGPQGIPGPVGPAGLTWSGLWSATSSYSMNYAVGYASASWWCISDVTGATGNDSPDMDTIHWTLLAAQGSPGPQGGQGEHGLDGPRGLTGATGFMGATGPIGVTGPTGPSGTFATSSFYIQGGTMYSYNTTSSIYRSGSLTIGTSSSSSSKLRVYSTQSGAFQLQDGTQAENYILSSDVNGVATWTNSNFITTPISLTYSGLQNLVDTNGLELGRRYILTNYLHKYQVLGSDSGAITQYYTMIGSLYDLYCQFNSVPSEVANGSIVTVVSVPPGATITPGTTYSVYLWYNEAYIRFSPTTAARVANIGTVFAFQKQRYPNVPTDSIILDNNSKVVMKKGGVINIDVHNGTDYMSMSASQNPSVQTEQLVLTAISDHQFSITAESLTYPGDVVEYLFDNSDILDEDGNPLGVQRSGFIIGRSNHDLNISMDKDWRTQRYRRYKIDPTNWTNLTLSGSSSTLYTLGGSNYGGFINSSLDDGHKYLLRYPYELDFYLDFYCDSIPMGTYSYTNTDTFKNGEGFGLPDPTWITPSIAASQRLGNDIVNIYNRSIIANGTTYSNLKYAFDYPIIPMDGHNPKSLVTKAKIVSLSNTVFKDLNQYSGSSRNFDLDINSINNSTIGTGNIISSNEMISSLKTIETFDIFNYGQISNLFISYKGELTNYGELYNCRISGNNSVGSVGLNLKINNSTIYNSIFGFGRADSFIISNAMINRSMFLIYNTQILSLSGALYHTSLNVPVSIYSTKFDFNNFNIQRQISSTQSKGLYGVKHTISSDVNNIQIDNYNPKLELVSKVLDINYGSLTYNIIGITE